MRRSVHGRERAAVKEWGGAGTRGGACVRRKAGQRGDADGRGGPEVTVVKVAQVRREVCESGGAVEGGGAVLRGGAQVWRETAARAGP